MFQKTHYNFTEQMKTVRGHASTSGQCSVKILRRCIMGIKTSRGRALLALTVLFKFLLLFNG